MSDDLKHCHCGCIYAEVDCLNCNYQSPADRIEQLERDYKDACNEAAECYLKQCVAERKLSKAAEALRLANKINKMPFNTAKAIHAVLAELDETEAAWRQHEEKKE